MSYILTTTDLTKKYGEKLAADRINIHIEMSAKIPNIDKENVSYTHQYISIDDITEDAVHTVAALKELGIDLEALASYAIK